LRHAPFAVAQVEDRLSGHVRRVEPEGAAEGGAGRQDAEFAVEQQKRRARRGDDRHAEALGDVLRFRIGRGSHGLPFRSVRRLTEGKPYPVSRVHMEAAGRFIPEGRQHSS